MYDESAVVWDKTRTSNWPVVAKYSHRIWPGMTVLDVGCGNGRLTQLIPENCKYLGIDFSQGLLELAKANYPKKKFIYGDVTDKESWQSISKYDAIFCVAVLHHIPDYQTQKMIMTELRKHWSEKGLLFVSVWNLALPQYNKYRQAGKSSRKTNPRMIEIPFAGKWQRPCFQFDLPYLRSLAEESGWDKPQVYYANRDGMPADKTTGVNLIAVVNGKSALAASGSRQSPEHRSPENKARLRINRK